MRRQPAERAATRTQFIETKGVFSWSIDGELWTFQADAQLRVGPYTCLDADPQTVSSNLAADMIRQSKAEAVCVRQLEGDLELTGVDREDAA